MEKQIVIDPDICHGKPVIRGTRMPVALVIGSLAGGMSFDEIQREYDLTAEDIRAALHSPANSSNKNSFIRSPANPPCGFSSMPTCPGGPVAPSVPSFPLFTKVFDRLSDFG